MPIKPFTLYTQYHSSEVFSLALKQNDVETKIIMKLAQGTVNTRELPQTFAILKKELPSVLRSTCYNDENIPFMREVLRTEVGHLFEHILIEYLCLMKIAAGADTAEVRGLTKWNWLLYPKGSFHITVSEGRAEMKVFALAMEKSIALAQLILQSNQKVINSQVPSDTWLHPDYDKQVSAN